MFSTIKKFYEEHMYDCIMAVGCVAGFAVSIPMVKWVYKAMAEAITIGINNSELARK